MFNFFKLPWSIECWVTTFILVILSTGVVIYQQDKSRDAAFNIKYTPTGRCQWDIGGMPMNFENIFAFKTIKDSRGDRIQYEFTMSDGKVHRFYTGTEFAVKDIVNEVRVCTQGKAFGHNLLF